MSIPPGNIQVGKCYLTRNEQVARVIEILPAGRVRYEFRNSAGAMAFGWNAAVTDLRSFSYLIEREVPCAWTPAAEETRP